ncbi:MAG: transcription antitermination factor NusB [Flaviflexus sp.]|nr:transcription antitermination factor NusB [Flaviflexus sp.]
MRANTTGRRRALDVIFEAEIKGILVPGLLRELLAERQNMSTAQVPIRGAGVELVEVVADHLYELDSLIDHYSTWGLRRLSRVDRAVLRLGIAELRYRGVDVPVVVSEYSGIIREIGSSRSVPFLTAIFNRVAEDMKEGIEPPTKDTEHAIDIAAASQLAEEAAQAAAEREASASTEKADEIENVDLAAAEPADGDEGTPATASRAAAAEADEAMVAGAAGEPASDEPEAEAHRLEIDEAAESKPADESAGSGHSEDRGESHAPQSLADIAGRNQAAHAAATGDNGEGEAAPSAPSAP